MWSWRKHSKRKYRCPALLLSILMSCSSLVVHYSRLRERKCSSRQATAEELTALLRQREAAVQTMKGLFSAKVRGGIIPIATRVEGAVYYRRPNAMRMRGFTAIGSELFEFVQARRSVHTTLADHGTCAVRQSRPT